MAFCEICRSQLLEGHCAFCADALRDRFARRQSAEFPFTAQAPEGAVDAQTLGRLRRFLLLGDLASAEQVWDGLLPGLRPIGVEGRRLMGEALEAFAVLKDHLGKAEDARRLRRRAASARKDPSELKFKQSRDDLHRWESHAWLRAQMDEQDAGRAARVAAVQRELERQLRLQDRRQRTLKLGACGLVGVATGPVLGLPLPLGGVLGAGLAWAWLRRQ